MKRALRVVGLLFAGCVLTHLWYAYIDGRLLSVRLAWQRLQSRQGHVRRASAP